MTMAKIGSICFYIVITAFTVWMAGHIMPENRKNDILQLPLQKNRNRAYYAVAYERFYLFGIFVVLFICSALRFNVGNDYEQYTQTAHEAFVDGYVVTEAGFNWLVKIVYAIFGFECYEAVFAVFAFVTLWLLLKAMYEQSLDFSMSFFLFMTLGIYFQTFNTVRYYLALAIVLYAMKYIWEKDWIRFVLWILFAALFHKSVLLVIPVYWLASKRWKTWQILGMLVLSVLAYILKGPVLQLALFLYPSYRGTVFLEGGTSVTSILRTAVILIVSVWYWHRYGNECKEQDKYWFYAQLNFVALLVYVFFSFLPVVTRIAYYFSISQLFLIPMVVHGIPKERMKKYVYGMMLVVCIGYLLLFLVQADKPGLRLLPYHSWVFSADRFIYK